MGNPPDRLLIMEGAFWIIKLNKTNGESRRISIPHFAAKDDKAGL